MKPKSLTLQQQDHIFSVVRSMSDLLPMGINDRKVLLTASLIQAYQWANSH